MHGTCERRRHKRVALQCHVQLFDGQAQAPLWGRSVNLSDGGLYVRMDQDASHRLGDMTVEISLPRSTPNTYMIETIRCQARIVRRDKLAQTHLAIQFHADQPLILEV